MKRTRYRRQGTCRVCGQDPGFEGVTLKDGKKLCIVCAWTVVEELRRVHNAPEITDLQRIRHRQEHGKDGPRRTAIPRDPAFIYYARVGNLIKIGFARDVRKRMRDYPPNAVLLAVHPGTKEVEREMHSRFRPHLARGREWFTPSDEIMAHIETTVEQFGSPAQHDYQFRQAKSEEDRVRDSLNSGHAIRNPLGRTRKL